MQSVAGGGSPGVKTDQPKYSILFVSDFAPPNFGGVETHMYQLAQSLISRGHKVCFLTISIRNERFGVRYYCNGLKVYYLPLKPVFNKAVSSFHNFVSIPVIRQILMRE